jgi:hypothetical protein
MSSRTSCAQRQAAANFEAHFRASSREETSTIAKPPRTAFVSGKAPSLMDPVRGYDGRPLALHAGTGHPHSRPLGLKDHLVRGLAYGFHLVVRNDHRAVIE